MGIEPRPAHDAVTDGIMTLDLIRALAKLETD